MAGQIKPGFITGANARIKLFDKTLAYCTDVSYNVTVQTIPIESMGKYEVHTNEPVSYSVDGTFSVIRYTKAILDANIDDASDNSGNAPLRIGDASGDNAFGHLNPGKILESRTFSLDIFQTIKAGRQDTGLSDANAQPVVRIKHCRLVRRGMTLNKRGVMVDNYAFVGIYLDDADEGNDGIAAPSGQEDLS